MIIFFLCIDFFLMVVLFYLINIQAEEIEKIGSAVKAQENEILLFETMIKVYKKDLEESREQQKSE